MHPAQNPTNASREANTIRMDNNITEIKFRSKKKKIIVNVENNKPTPWANLFGGPGTSISLLFNLGTKTFVTKSANGLTFGPDDTLAKKP